MEGRAKLLENRQVLCVAVMKGGTTEIKGTLAAILPMSIFLESENKTLIPLVPLFIKATVTHPSTV